MKKFYLFVFRYLFLFSFPLNSNFVHVGNQPNTFGISASLLFVIKGFPKNPLFYFSQPPTFDKNNYENIEKGDVVWVQCKFVKYFFESVFPDISDPFILVITDGDESFPSQSGLLNIEHFLKDSRIIHIFAQNCDYDGSSTKITPWPIGLDFHTIAYKSIEGGWGERGSAREQEKQLNKLLKNFKPTHLRKLKAFVEFHHADTMHGEFNRYLQFGEDRTMIFQQLLSQNVIDYSQWMRRSKVWETKRQYAFSISPHGNGLDCHRTWEDLILGCIVIVKTSILDPLYEGLPVIIVDDWKQVTLENMQTWLLLYGDVFNNNEYRVKLTNYYWTKKITDLQKTYQCSNSH